MDEWRAKQADNFRKLASKLEQDTYTTFDIVKAQIHIGDILLIMSTHEKDNWDKDWRDKI